MPMEHNQYADYGKKKKHADLYEQFIDKSRVYENIEKKENPKKAKPPKWTPEDQALEDILWAS